MDNMNLLRIVPSPRDEMPARNGELAVLSAPGCQATLRISIDYGPQDTVRLEQLAHSRSAGWYTQKSFCIPRPLLKELLTELRKADCLMPRSTHDESRPMRLVPQPPP